MNILVNKLKTEVDPGINLYQLLEQMNISTQYIAIEVNEEIVPKSEYEKFNLNDGDKIEIVTAIGGG